MKRLARITTVAVVVFSAAAMLEASPTNPGFETGDLTGWSTSIPSGASLTVVTTHEDALGRGTTSWTAAEGGYFVLLKTDGPGNFTQLYQSFSAAAGDVLAFQYFWDSQDRFPANDVAAGRLLSGVGPGGPAVATLFEHSVWTDPDKYWGTPWTPVSYTFTTAGTYTVLFEVANGFDGLLDSYVGIDSPRSPVTPVPAPGALLLAGMGITLGGWLCRRRKAAEISKQQGRTDQ